MPTSEVLIVGAGFAGAACALRLAQHGIKSTVLEAQQRIGGRAYTVKLAENVLVDFGASNVHGYERADNPARKLAESLGVELRVPKPGPGLVYGPDKQLIPSERLSKLQSEIARIMSEREPEEGHISLGKRILHVLRTLDPLAEPLARTAEVGAGIPLESISARYWKTERGFAGVDALPVGGYSNLVKMALDKSGAQVLLGKEVTSVKDQSDDIVAVTTTDGDQFTAKNVILTIPVAVLQTHRVSFNPPLPEERLSLLNSISVGLLDKIGLLYQASWWPKAPGNFVFLPSAAISTRTSDPRSILETSTVMIANMCALTPDKIPVLLVYLAVDTAKALEGFGDEELTVVLHEYICSRLGDPKMSPTSGKMVRWGADSFALGATTSPIALGKDAEPDHLDIIGRPLWDGKLGFAGEGTDRHLRGSVPGAVASGEREAHRLVVKLQA